MRLSLGCFIFLLLTSSSCTPSEIDQTPPVAPKEQPAEYFDSFEDVDNKSKPSFRNPKLEKYWIENPNITHCTSSGVSEYRMREAIRFWTRIGYEFGEISVGNDSEMCLLPPVRGEILITIITNDITIGSNLAVTKVSFFTKTSEILSARIFMIPGYANKSWILEHEIGHALGGSHYSKDRHIMHPVYTSLGATYTGLSYRYYEDWRSYILQKLR